MQYDFSMKRWLAAFFFLAQIFLGNDLRAAENSKVFILPIRDDIMPPLVYLVRRGVKEAMEAKAELLILDMDTNGGRIDTTEEIIGILNQFKGKTVTYVNQKAFSAGAFISFATQKIYMAPQSVIGAAAPIMMSPGGTGVEAMPDTVEAKMSSGVSALVRANAEKNGYNVEVADAMVKRTKELKIGDKVLNEKGQILTLTDTEAAQLYGQPPKPLLSSGTVVSLNALLERLGYGHAQIRKITPSGVEKLGSWINTISPILLMIGAIGIYLEFKMPGVILPGIIGVAAFAIYFLGGYVAGLSGAEWVAIFIVGLALVAVELFVFPGTIAVGLGGVGLMIVAIVMAMVDMYPGMPSWPTLPQLRIPLQTISIAFFGSLVAIGILAKLLPRTSLYGALVSQSASGVKTDQQLQKQQSSRQGQIGVTISPLRPGGKAQFGQEILDVMSQGDLVARGQKVKIIGHSGSAAIVEVIG